MKTIQKYCTKLKYAIQKEESLQQSYLIDEAQKMQELKKDIEEKVKEKVKK